MKLAITAPRSPPKNPSIVFLGETQEYEPLSRAAYYKALVSQKEEILKEKNSEN